MEEHPQYAAYREQVPMLVPALPRPVSMVETTTDAGGC
jgi:hypothetical protein